MSEYSNFHLCFVFVQAKQHYESEEKKKELKRLRGEDTWMLPELNQRLQQIEQVRCCFCLWSRYKVCLRACLACVIVITLFRITMLGLIGIPFLFLGELSWLK